MSSTVALPDALREQIADVAARVRLLRALRGASLTVLLLALTAGAAFLVDHFVDLPQEVRIANFLVWLGLGALVLVFGLLVPVFRRLSSAGIAAAVEEHYPELGERLTTSVELTELGEADLPSHGSPALLGLLVSDTEERTQRLDFAPAISAGRTWALTSLATLAVALLIAPAFVYPNELRSLAGRFFLPWRTDCGLAPVAPSEPFDLVVYPGDTYAALGRPLTIAVRAEPHHEDVVLPEQATLVIRDDEGNESRLDMPADPDDEIGFVVNTKVAGNFSYFVELGAAVSESYRVTAVKPVELAADSPTITITPPKYAQATLETEKRNGLVEVSALKHSEVRFGFQFTVPAEGATLTFTTKSATPQTKTYPLPLSNDRLSAELAVPAMQSGEYRVTMLAPHGIRTEPEGSTFTVKADLPPALIKFNGRETLRAVRPDDRLPIEVTLADDIGVAQADLQYRLAGSDKIVEEPIPLRGANAREAVGRHLFVLAGKAQPSQTIEYRIRFRDNLPAQFAGPHTVYYPADRWLELKVVEQGKALAEQDIVAQRDQIARQIEKIKQDVKAEARGVLKVQAESRGRPELDPEQARRVRELRKDNQASERALNKLADDASEMPGLQQLADKAQEVAEQEMRQAEKALAQSAAKNQPAANRHQRFEEAQQRLSSALKKLDELAKMNERLAQDRLAQAKVEQLADRQKQLAQKADELSAKHPVLDPTAKKDAEQIKQEQQKVAQELDKLTRESPALQKALDEARAEQARRSAEEARELARRQEELARASEETTKERAKEGLAAIAEKQAELARRAEKLAEETARSARINANAGLKTEDTKQAVEALKEGDTQKALQKQDQSAANLDRLGFELQRATAFANDPRLAANELAAQQERLRQRAQREMNNRATKVPLAKRLEPIQREQEAIRRAAEELAVPPKVAQTKKQATEPAARAAKMLEKAQVAPALAQMDQTRQALQRLANQIGEQRRQAQQAVQNLQRQQEEVARKIEEAARNSKDADRHLAQAARKQAEVAEALSKLDAFRHEARQEKAQSAANRALADLLDRRQEDLAASQAEAKKQIDRLAQALRGEKTTDERVAELAKRQRALAEESAKAEANAKTPPRQREQIKQKQAEIAQTARDLPSWEAPQRQQEAARSAAEALKEARNQPTSQATREAMKKSAEKLEALARQLAGEETDAERAQRLAKQQALAAAEAEREAKARRPGQPPSGEAQKKQRDIATEARNIRGGEEAKEEKKRATDALARAAAARGEEEAKAKRAAADALKDLADKLAGRDSAAARATELAREQRELAKETARGGEKAAAQEARKAADRQAELARQLDRLAPKGGEKAIEEARQKMAEAKKALESAKSPAQAKEQVAKAAEAVEKAAQQLQKEEAGKQPMGPTRTTSARPSDQPAKMAQEIAREQKKLASTTRAAQQSAARKGAEGKKALEKALEQMAGQQRELNKKASQLPATGNQKALQEAREAMNQAEKALAKKDANSAGQKQTQAAAALDRLSRQLASAKKAPPPAPKVNPQGLPSPEQIQKARELAQDQRALREEVRQAIEGEKGQAGAKKEGPVGELAKEQAGIAEEAGRLAKNVTAKQGNESPAGKQATGAQKSAQKAAQAMSSGALPKAAEAGKKAGEQLSKLAQQLARSPGGEEAKQLAGRQEALNRKMQPLAQDTEAQRAAQKLAQGALEKQASDLGKAMEKLGSQTPRPQEGQLAREAAQSARQAAGAMKQAQGQARQGNPTQAQRMQKEAARALERAAAQAERAAGQPTASKEGTPKEAGQSVRQAQGQMEKAQGQMSKGQTRGAQASMKQAAEALQQAAQALAKGMQSSRPPTRITEATEPNRSGKGTGGKPDANLFGKYGAQYVGKSWGELPGELRTRIVQDMKSRYGEDYARMIKLYFEQLADTRKK